MAGDKLRPFGVEDLFNLEGLGEYFGGPFSFSSDGTLAYTRTRPANTLSDYRWVWLLGNGASDVWLQSGRDEPVNLTHGATDGSGWWAPEWSPNGRYLAMLSTRGGKVRAWVWDTKNAELKLVSDEAVDARGDVRGLWWLSDTILLFPAGPEGDSSSRKRMGLSTPEVLAREWPKVSAGMETTSSVLESGATGVRPIADSGRLMIIDVSTGKAQIILNTAPALISPSPSGKQIAYMQVVSGAAPSSGKEVSFDNEQHVFGLVAADGTKVDLAGDRIVTGAGATLRWSPDGHKLAILEADAGNGETATGLYIVDSRAGTSRRVHLKPQGTDGALPPVSRLVWVEQGALLVGVPDHGDNPKPGKGKWWLVQPDGTAQEVGNASGHMPSELWAQSGHAAFVGLADEKLIRVRSGGEVETLDNEIHAPIASLEWPLEAEEGDVLQTNLAEGFDQIIFSTGSGATKRTFIKDLPKGRLHHLKTPASDARLVAYDPKGRSALFLRNDEKGLYLWRTWQSGVAPMPLIVANTFLKKIQPAVAKQIRYKSLGGTELVAWLLLPPNRQAGQTIPLLTYVYPGSTASDSLPWGARLTTAMPLNLQIPVAKGYAVLIPSMPMNDADTDPMLHLTDGVLPAIDQAIQEEGLDPDRVYLLGHSYGGYAALGLITQTRRFAAAVSMAGISNLASMYGQFDARMRYQNDAVPDAMRGMLWTEVGQGGMAKPPWERPARYLRNSPVFHVGDISTPVMLIHGDLDAVPIQQAEEMFTALYREGKRARFVRYWGEGHILSSPANIRDLWVRIFAWFDEQPTQ